MRKTESPVADPARFLAEESAALREELGAASAPEERWPLAERIRCLEWMAETPRSAERFEAFLTDQTGRRPEEKAPLLAVPRREFFRGLRRRWREYRRRQKAGTKTAP
jgi:hypothetical protein